MKNLLIIFSIFCSLGLLAQSKTIKLKKSKTSINYSKDSIDVKKKEFKKMSQAFIEFYKAINDSNYNAYSSMLSTNSRKNIASKKLERKFLKFRSYKVPHNELIFNRNLKVFTEKSFENNMVYVIVFKLPENSNIPKRVGFDPLKRETFSGVENHVGLHMVKEGKSYKVVILF